MSKKKTKKTTKQEQLECKGRRMEYRLDAEKFLEKHNGPIAQVVAQVADEMWDEIEWMPKFQQDAAMAAEVAYRLDKKVKLPSAILEALDGPIIFFVALGAIGIWRLVQNKQKRQENRLERITERLEELGKDEFPRRRARLEKRVRNLRRKLGLDEGE